MCDPWHVARVEVARRRATRQSVLGCVESLVKEKVQRPLIEIHYAENLQYLKSCSAGMARLVYIDPPFNTGKVQARKRTRKVRDEAEGDHVGFGGKRYSTHVLSEMSFGDSFEEFGEFLLPRLEEARRVLTDDGSLFLHLDYRECHYAKVLCDAVFGRDCFKNEIIWSYDFGGRPKNRWPAKHDNILWYTVDPDAYVFRYEDIDRIPYLAPGLVTAEKVERGKVPTDVWWQTIVPTNSRERTGYPTQKPVALSRRIINVHSDPGDMVLDFFAGSGTTGVAAAELGRSAVLVDNNAEALEVMERRLERYSPTYHQWPVEDRTTA